MTRVAFPTNRASSTLARRDSVGDSVRVVIGGPPVGFVDRKRHGCRVARGGVDGSAGCGGLSAASAGLERGERDLGRADRDDVEGLLATRDVDTPALGMTGRPSR